MKDEDLHLKVSPDCLLAMPSVSPLFPPALAELGMSTKHSIKTTIPVAMVNNTEFPIPSFIEVFRINLGSSPGLWAAPAASYCPSRPGELPKQNMAKPHERWDGKLCRLYNFRLPHLRLRPRAQGRLLPQRRRHHLGQPLFVPHRPPQEEPQGKERQAAASAPGRQFYN